MTDYREGSIGDLLTKALQREQVKQQRRAKMRTWGIWIAGVLGFGIVGTIVADRLDKSLFGGEYAPWGFIAGALLFTCFRLWKAEKPEKMPLYDLKDGKLG